jgi:hypothetical protein
VPPSSTVKQGDESFSKIVPRHVPEHRGLETLPFRKTLQEFYLNYHLVSSTAKCEYSTKKRILLHVLAPVSTFLDLSGTTGVGRTGASQVKKRPHPNNLAELSPCSSILPQSYIRGHDGKCPCINVVNEINVKSLALLPLHTYTHPCIYIYTHPHSLSLCLSNVAT